MKYSEAQKRIKEFSACEKLVITKIREEAKKRNPNWQFHLSSERNGLGNSYVLFDKEKHIVSDLITTSAVYRKYGFKTKISEIYIKYTLSINKNNAHGRIKLKEDCKIKPEKFVEKLLDSFEQYIEKRSAQIERAKKREDLRNRCLSIEKKLKLFTWNNVYSKNSQDFDSYLLIRVDSLGQATDILKRSKKLPWLKFKECENGKAKEK